jgi:hypothetical protein
VRGAVLALTLMGAAVSPLSAGPFIWDDDENKIDDRVETVHALGYTFSFEQADSSLRQRIDVLKLPLGLVFGVYVLYDHTPTQADFDTLTLLGLPVLHRFESVPAVRSAASFLQIQLVSGLSGVVRVEAVPLAYPEVREAVAGSGIRDSGAQVFPNWTGEGGADGTGVVVAILDSGINDQPNGGYPGHESLAGRFVGGAVYTNADYALNTPRTGSVNPIDNGTSGHGTHVAGIILGSGGPSGFLRGAAPGARFVDVKVLGSSGRGTSIPEAIDWCFYNRARDWNGDPQHAGIDVINLSVSSLDESDGNDVGSLVANRVVQEGIVLVASMGNEGLSNYCPSPASADAAIAVGAWDSQRTAAAEDDQFPAFSDFGPRADDGDADAADEQKPDLIASGVAVLSADGRMSGTGAEYRRLSGTSMSAAVVAGAVALLRSEFPQRTPAEIADLLRTTARRNVSGLPPGTAGADPRWYSPIGYGVLDLYAARLEWLQPERTQVRRFGFTGSENQINAFLWTQRERGAKHLVFERATDAGGTPGPFAAFDSVATAGDSSLALTNLAAYARTWAVPPAERGMTFWYRIACTEAGVRWNSPSRAFTSPQGPPSATVECTIVHNAFNTDIDAVIEIAGSQGSPALAIPLGGTSSAIASDWVNGTSTLGNIAWTFRVEVPSGAANAYLPPTPSSEWRLRVTEGGFINRSGRVTDFRVTHHVSGNPVYVGGPTPRQTMEGQTWHVQTPVATAGIEPGGAITSLRFGPNPVRAGHQVAFALGADPGDALRVYDLSGRRIATIPFHPFGNGFRAVWEVRDEAGRLLPSGLYFARAGTGGTRRIAVIDR